MSLIDLKKIISIASKGDTSQIEALFKKPGGRKFLETTIMMMVNQLPTSFEEKADYVESFITIMDNMEQRIKHQKRGERILQQAFEE